jgi:hypothetical protein
MLKQRNKPSVYRSKLRETVDKPNHTADRRKVSASNSTGRSSTRNSVWMVKTDLEVVSMPGNLIKAQAKTDKTPHNPQGNLFCKKKRDLQRL